MTYSQRFQYGQTFQAVFGSKGLKTQVWNKIGEMERKGDAKQGNTKLCRNLHSCVRNAGQETHEINRCGSRALIFKCYCMLPVWPRCVQINNFLQPMWVQDAWFGALSLPLPRASAKKLARTRCLLSRENAGPENFPTGVWRKEWRKTRETGILQFWHCLSVRSIGLYEQSSYGKGNLPSLFTGKTTSTPIYFSLWGVWKTRECDSDV